MNLKDARKNKVEIAQRDSKGRVTIATVESCHNGNRYEVHLTRSLAGIAATCFNQDEGHGCPARGVCHHVLAVLLAMADLELCADKESASLFEGTTVPVMVNNATIYAVYRGLQGRGTSPQRK